MRIKKAGDISKDTFEMIKNLIHPKSIDDSVLENVDVVDSKSSTVEDPRFDIFKSVISDDKKRFLELYEDLKSKDEDGDITELDKLLSTYFDGDPFDRFWSMSVKLSERIENYLDGYVRSQDTRKIALEMLIILQFMDQKRESIKVLFEAMDLDSDDKKEILAHRVISDAEMKEFLKNPTSLTIKKLLRRRKMDDWIR